MVIKCKTISTLLQDTNGEFIYLDLTVAHILARKGEVQMIETQNGKAITQQVQILDDKEYLTRSAFSSSGKSKVAWVQDNYKNGGAELSSLVVARIGTQLGFNIVAVTPDNFKRQTLQDADIIILSNMFEFTDPQLQEIYKHIFNCKQIVVKYEHDHREITLRLSMAKRVFARADHCVFISPRQCDDHLSAGVIMQSYSVLPLAINIEEFTNHNLLREKGQCLVPSAHKCQVSAAKYIKEHPENKYTCIGADLGGQFIPEVDVMSMPEIFNRFEKVLHVPDNRGGGERVIFEAILCGCEVITNDKAYHTSWEKSWDWRNPAVLKFQLRKAPYEFWRNIRKLENTKKP